MAIPGLTPHLAALHRRFPQDCEAAVLIQGIVGTTAETTIPRATLVMAGIVGTTETIFPLATLVMAGIVGTTETIFPLATLATAGVEATLIPAPLTEATVRQ
jgi:hypothetical protein